MDGSCPMKKLLNDFEMIAGISNNCALLLSLPSFELRIEN
jgi:hypothetical protein